MKLHVRGFIFWAIEPEYKVHAWLPISHFSIMLQYIGIFCLEFFHEDRGNNEDCVHHDVIVRMMCAM